MKLRFQHTFNQKLKTRKAQYWHAKNICKAAEGHSFEDETLVLMEERLVAMFQSQYVGGKADTRKMCQHSSGTQCVSVLNRNMLYSLLERHKVVTNSGGFVTCVYKWE